MEDAMQVHCFDETGMATILAGEFTVVRMEPMLLRCRGCGREWEPFIGSQGPAANAGECPQCHPPARGPRSATEYELGRVGVEIIDESRFWLRCMDCSETWSPDIPSRSMGQKLQRGYWKCPNCGGRASEAPEDDSVA
jgi:Zn finger protein HypA/HybF involved in hydrogenase expression